MKNTSRLLEIINRSLTGPIIEEEEFNKLVTRGIRRVVKDYEIRFSKDQIINQDDDLADRTWKAALDFLAQCGVYCQSTSRIIRFDECEIISALDEAPDQIWLGSGGDAVLEKNRKVEDDRIPLNMGSPIGSPISEEMFVPLMVSYIQEPLVDVTCPASLISVHGHDIRVGSPLEILAAWHEVDLMQIALARAGRPGMAWTGLVLSMSDIGQLSAVNPLGLKPTNLNTFGVISELKINFEILNKLAHSIRMGGIIDPYANPIYGGLGGGVEGQAVLITAAMIALSVVCMATCCGSSPTHPFYFNDTGKEILQACGLSFQAIARNSHLLTNLTITPVGGPGTRTLLFETAAFTIVSTVSGISRILGPRSATGAVEAHFSGLEARFCGKMLRSAAGMKRDFAEELVQKIYRAYESQIDQKPYGLPFEQVYDLKRIQPLQSWLELYDDVLAELTRWGLPSK